MAKWYVTPWPEQIARKIEMGRTIPASDFQHNRGTQHHLAFHGGAKYLNQKRDELLRHAQVDLCDDNRTADSAVVNVRRMFFGEIGGGCFQSEVGQYLA